MRNLAWRIHIGVLASLLPFSPLFSIPFLFHSLSSFLPPLSSLLSSPSSSPNSNTLFCYC